MITYPKISIVTVNYNGAEFLEATILSVLNQKYPNLEYIIMDGGSTDGSLEIIKRYQDKITYWSSEKDEGQYHAVQKGFEKSTGEIMAWINSDDLYVPYCFFEVAKIFTQFSEVSWLTGIPREYTESGAMLSRITLPWGRWSKYRYYTFDFQFIQQESTFWRRALWEKAGSKMSLDTRYAGDMELWARFFRHERLHTTLATFAGFRYSSQNQRSIEFRKEYLKECHAIIRRELNLLGVPKRLLLIPLRVVGLITGPFFFFDVPIFNLFYPLVFRIPPPLGYDFVKKSYIKKKSLVKHPPLYLFGRQVSLKMFD